MVTRFLLVLILLIAIVWFGALHRQETGKPNLAEWDGSCLKII